MKVCAFVFSMAMMAYGSNGAVGTVPMVPDLDKTPGAICDESDRDFAGYRYKERIPYCERNVSSELKAHIYDTYGIPEKCRGFYTIDHLIPLSIGGNNSIENLWPEHQAIKKTRLHLEQEIFEAVSNGQMTQKEAMDIIYSAKLNPSRPRFPSGSCHRTEASNY